MPTVVRGIEESLEGTGGEGVVYPEHPEPGEGADGPNTRQVWPAAGIADQPTDGVAAVQPTTHPQEQSVAGVDPGGVDQQVSAGCSGRIGGADREVTMIY